ncbi:MAG: hypothetical protein ACYT04_76265, partial [Nostoc sp.]
MNCPQPKHLNKNNFCDRILKMKIKNKKISLSVTPWIQMLLKVGNLGKRVIYVLFQQSQKR